MKCLQRPSLGIPLGESWLGVAALCLLVQSAAVLSTASNLGEALELPFDVIGPFTGALISVSAVVAGRGTLPTRGLRRWAMLAVLVVVSALIGAVASDGVESALRLRSEFGAWKSRLASMIALPALIAVLAEFQQRREAARAALHDEHARVTALQGQMAEAQLQLLQAQIEPHFLFNSLANIRRLSSLDSEAGAVLLSNLLRVLESALPLMRGDESTVAKETELTRAFLAIHQVRMGRRLTYSLRVVPETSDARLPTMMLLTLVENALKHGIGPLPEGGRIDVLVQRSGDGRLNVVVTDNGGGLKPAIGHGVGLANIRARLRSMFGDSASLSLYLNEPRGVMASIVLPERHA